MKLKMRVSVVAVALIARASPAQLLTARGIFLNPGRDTTSGPSPRTDAFASIEASLKRSKTFQSDDYRLGAIVDVFRFGPSTSLGLLLATEMKVAPDNSIGFDPRGVVWEEQVGLTRRKDAVAWSLAGFLRCRHDVDNGTPVEPLDSLILIVPHGRTIVLQGFQLVAEPREFRLDRRGGVAVNAQVEAYTSREDRRTPASTVSPRWNDARSAAIISARMRYALTNHLEAFARSWESHVVFVRPGTSSVQSNVRGELGLRISSPGIGWDVFFTRERTFDDAMSVEPRRFVSSSVGVRVASARLF